MDSSSNNIRSRKRTRSSSSSKCDELLSGTFTRSKSQIYIHRNRSGYARPDSTRERFIKGPEALMVKVTKEEVVRLDVKVKDLRARRVFSPSASSVNNGGFEDDDDVSKGGEVGGGDVIKVAEKIDAGGGGGGGGLICDDDVIKVGEIDVCKNNGDDADVSKGVEIGVADVSKGGEIDGDVNVNGGGGGGGEDVSKGGEIGGADVTKVSEVDVCEESVGDVIKGGEAGGDDVSKDGAVVVDDGDDVSKAVEMRPVVNSDVSLVAKEVVDINKTQSTVTSLRARRKVFKSPSSFSYRRMLSYLQDTDSSNFEIVEAKLPEKVSKLGNNAPNIVTHGDQEISAVSVSINSTDETSEVESSDVVQKSHDVVLNETSEECEQMTPPDADIYTKPKTDKTLDVVVKPTPKPVLTPCYRRKMLHTPTSFTHRRLLPFLMNVAEDGLGTMKGNQSSKAVKGIEQIQQPPNVGVDEPRITRNPEQQDAANEKSDSPTSTLTPVDKSLDRTKTVTLVSSDNLLDAHVPEMECTQSESVEFDNSIKLELSSPKDKAIENVSNICSKQFTAAENDLTGLGISCSEDNQTLQITPLMTPAITGENCRNGILKRTPRGCRGICNCLNCTSFRLHAERSFEFSRNQMRDAEEVALELINDLTSLRKILETTVGGSNSLATDKEKQIKEACEKALYKEEVAKSRLSQMNEDLSFHCRSMKLMRPNVTFANKIEEKLISKDVCGKRSV